MRTLLTRWQRDESSQYQTYTQYPPRHTLHTTTTHILYNCFKHQSVLTTVYILISMTTTNTTYLHGTFPALRCVLTCIKWRTTPLLPNCSTPQNTTSLLLVYRGRVVIKTSPTQKCCHYSSNFSDNKPTTWTIKCAARNADKDCIYQRCYIFLSCWSIAMFMMMMEGNFLQILTAGVH